MPIFDSFKKTIADLPISDIHKARLELAADQSALLERQIEELRSKAAKLEVELDIAKSNEQKTRLELDELKKLHAEDVRVIGGAEARRGSRTGGAWTLFCPVCHSPAYNAGYDSLYYCTDGKCEWRSSVQCGRLDQLLGSLQ